MMIELLLFASSKDLFGKPRISIELSNEATVGDLKAALTAQQPDAASLIQRCAFSVDQQYANDSTVLHAKHEIAMIPPVSGG